MAERSSATGGPVDDADDPSGRAPDGSGPRWIKKTFWSTLVSVDQHGAFGDYDPETSIGTDDTAAIQAAIDAMVANGDNNSPSVLHFPAGYYKITSSLNFPAGWLRNHIEGNGAIIFYRGPVDRAAAILKFTETQVVQNTINNLQLRCEDRCGYGLYVASATADIVFSENVFNNCEIMHPTVRAIQLGDYTESGFDVDAAHTTFNQLRIRLKGGQAGVAIDAPNAFNVSFTNCFFGASDSSDPESYLTVLNGAGIYIYGLFTGNNRLGRQPDNSDGVPAIDLRDGNTAIFGWNTEGSLILKMSGFVGERCNVLVENVLVNDSLASATPTCAIVVAAGELTLRSATLGKSNIHPRKIKCSDALIADGVYLGTNADGSIRGSYELENPDRCLIEGRRVSDVRALNANPNFDLWWGSAVDDMPIGYEKSPLGRQTIQQSTSDARHTPYTAEVKIVSSAAVSGHFIDGIRTTQIPIRFNTSAGSRNCALVVRGKVSGMRGTGAVKARLIFVDRFGNALNSHETTVTPDADGSFTAMVSTHPANDTVTSMVGNVGLGVVGAAATIRLQTFHLLQMTPYTRNGSENWRVLADVWTRYSRPMDLVHEYAKAGITARWFAPGQYFIREWLGSEAPSGGSYVPGDTVINSAPTPGGASAWICVTGGKPGTWVAKSSAA